jgi:hypothetical protein
MLSPKEGQGYYKHGVGFQTTLFGKVLPDVQTTWQHVRTLHSVPEYSRSLLWMRKGVTTLIVRTLGQAVRMRSCFGKNIAILERRLQKTV